LGDGATPDVARQIDTEREQATMTRNLKILGLALAAVLAMTAVMASAAQATKFHATKYPVKLTAIEDTQDHVFKAGGGQVTCNTTDFTGTATEDSSTQTINATYDECEALENEATIDGFGLTAPNCDYLFHASGTADLKCKAGTQVVITTPVCNFTVPAQNGLATLKFTNKAASGITQHDITVDINVTKIKYTIDNVFLCNLFLKEGHEAGKTYEDGVYEGNSTLKGYEDINGTEGASVGVEWDDTIP
jgi:hypothetical protein